MQEATAEATEVSSYAPGTIGHQVALAELAGVQQVTIFREKDQAENIVQVCNRWLKQNHERIRVRNVQHGWEPLHGAILLVWWRYR